MVLEEIDTAGAIVMDRDRMRIAQKENDEKMMENFNFFGDFKKQKKTRDNTSKRTKNARDKKKKQLEMKISKERMCLENDLKAQLKKEEITENKMKKYLELFDEDAKLDFESLDVEEDEKNEKSESEIFDDVLTSKNGIHLGDLLNVFDGITELKDFVCVITTNHKEFLDPALIRPGRITYEIELTKMHERDIEQMLEFYFIQHDCQKENIPIEDKKMMISRIAKNWDGKFAPSKIETECFRNSLQSIYESLSLHVCANECI